MTVPKRESLKGLPFSIIRLSQIDSTNRFLKDYAHHWRDDGLVVVADCQTAGRGRFGKRWDSPRGDGLYFSVLIAPIEPQRALLIPLAAGVVLHETLSDVFPVLQPGLDLKWPNDLLLSGKKVAGILAELEHLPEGNAFVVLGVGVNCNQSSFPEEIPDAVSLRQRLGITVDPASLLDAFLVRWHGYRSAWRESVRKAGAEQGGVGTRPLVVMPDVADAVGDWKARSTFWRGKPVRFVANGSTLEGTARDVAASGALVVELKSGELKELFSSEIEWIRTR